MTVADIKPRVLVIGLGSYFRKLRQGIQDHLEVARVVDCKPLHALNLTRTEYAKFRQFPVDLRGLTIDDSIDCVMLLTPPAFHLPHIERLARFQKPIFVEKPVVTSSVEIPRLRQAVEENPRLYCSDFYPDVRAIPLLTWVHSDFPSPLRPKIRLLSGDRRLWQSGLARFGAVERVEGKLLEGSGPAGTFEGREWLWDPSQGGVLLDLTYHYISLSSYLFDQDILPEKVVLRTRRDSSELVKWHPELGVAETYARVDGRFSGGVPFNVEVAKYWKTGTERHFTLYCSSGIASMLFKDPNVLVLKSGSTECEVCLEGNYYDHVVRCYVDYLRTGEPKPHGLDHALRAVRTIDEIKKGALRG